MARRVESRAGELFLLLNGHAAAQHASYEPVSQDNPARPGEVVTLYLTAVFGSCQAGGGQRMAYAIEPALIAVAP